MLFFFINSISSNEKPPSGPIIYPIELVTCWYNLPDKLNILESYSFYNTVELNQLEFPDSLQQIGTKVFVNCKNWKRVKLPLELISIQSEAFYSLENLVTVPNTKYNYRDNPYSIVNTKSDLSKEAHDKAFRRALKFANQNYIHTNNLERYQWDERQEYQILGFPALTVKKYYGITQILLFGKFLIFEIKKNYRIDKETL
jgi:hypothetical protein